MKKQFTRMTALLVVLMTASMAMAQTFTYPVKGEQGFQLTEKTRDGLRISYNLGTFSMSQLDYKGEAMSEISIQGIVLPNVAGCPNLPTESRMMAVPQGAKATLSVVHADRQVIQNVNIAPALRIQAETEEPDTDYKKDPKVYNKNAFYPENPFVMDKAYIRGVDAVTVAITPFQYNPVTKELAVYTNIELAVRFEGGTGHFGDDRLRSPYWDPILAAELMNYDQLPKIDYEARMQQWLRDGAQGAEYLIITPNNDAWAEYAKQLKDYRTRQGIITEVYRLDEMPANSTAAMKTWFHNAYHNWTIAPVAVCLLGDHNTNMGQGIPAETTYHPYSDVCITDNFYADAEGNDNLPDMVFSRLVAQNANELPVFVGKQIEYEYTNPNMEPSFYTSPITALGWQTERWFQLCSEVFGGYMRNHGYNTNRINCIYDGSPGDIWSSAQNTNMVVSYFGPSGTNYIPSGPSELGGWTGGAPEQVVEAVNNGAFWLQHRDHGLAEGWGEPAVRNSHVSQMTNVNRLTFLMSINCETGKFNYTGSAGNCFTEKWMRHTYNNQNAGAVGVLSPTEVSYSFVNDAYVWGVYDLFDGDFMPNYGPYASNTGNWMPAFGNVAGKYFLYQCSWPYNVEDKDITYTMFTAHCDAFLRVYTQVPQVMDITHPEVLLTNMEEINVTAPEGCTISLVTENDEGGWDILAVATATGETQTIHIEPQFPPTVVHIVATGQNYLRYENTMEVIPDAGPYIVFNDKTINDENGNGQLDYGETINLDITLKNVGADPMDAFEAVLETTSEYITIINGTAQYSAMAPDGTQTLQNAFTIRVADDIPDKVSNAFTITVNNGDNAYISKLSMKAYAPVFQLGGMTISEISGNGNNRLDPGETASLHFSIENRGHSQAGLTTTELQLLSPYLTFSDNTVEFDTFDAGDVRIASFDVAVNEDTPLGYVCPIVVNVNSGHYLDIKDYSAKVGLIIEDFESGDLDEGWTNNGGFPWTFESNDAYEGNYCLKSGAIGNNGSTIITLQHEAGTADTISFFFKVSSETNYDKLHFYIDNQPKGEWSGSLNWQKASFPVIEGVHTYKWSYTKDVSMSSGQDCAWIDYISLPSPRILSGTAGYDVTVCEGNDAQIVGYAIHYDNLLWTTSGDGTFDDATIAMPLYTPGPQDLVNRQVTLSVSIHGQDEVINDEMTVFIVDNIAIENTHPDMHYCSIAEPQEIGVTVTGDYEAFYWTTSGDGVFGDPHALETTYTPGEQDLLNGVIIEAVAVSAGCGPLHFDYPFSIEPLYFSFPLPNCMIEVCQGEDYVIDYEGSGYIDGQMTVEINGTTYPLTEGQPLTLPTAGLEPGHYDYEFHNLTNGFCSIDPQIACEITVVEKPVLTVANPTIRICAGETAQFELSVTGGEADDPGFTIYGTGIDSIAFSGHEYLFEVTPEENTEFHLSQISAWISGCGTPCYQDLDLTLSVIIDEHVAVPELIGDDELDVYLSPSTTYSIGNGVPCNFSIVPQEAATLTTASNNLSVTVNWNEGYKGHAVLTASPISGCNEGSTSMSIVVKNSMSVGDWNNTAKVYPNPTNGKVNIEAEGMKQVTVFNAMGQKVYGTEVDADQLSIDMKQFPAGSYIIRIVTTEGVCTKRVNVIR